MSTHTSSIQRSPIDIPTPDDIARRIDNLGIPRPAGGASQHLPPGSARERVPAQDPLAALQIECQKMLDYRSTQDLQALARVRGISPTQEREALITELSRQLCDLRATLAALLDADPIGLRILTYLHLVLTPGRGLSIVNAIKELADKMDSAYLFHDDKSKPPADALLAEDVPEALIAGLPDWSPGVRVHLRRVYGELTLLSQQGLLFPFKQSNTTYYSVPLTVRACLPPGLVLPAYPEEKAVAMQVQTRSHRAVMWSLYAVWNVLSRHQQDSTRHEQPLPFVRSAPPSRQPIEEQWPAFQGWDHVPAEIADLAKSRTQQNRSTYWDLPGRQDFARKHGERTTSATPFNQPITIPTPDYRLPRADLALVRAETARDLAFAHDDEEIEFYCALLEQLEAVTGGPGRPIVAHRDRMQRLLSLPLAVQMQTICQAWLSHMGWSEMDMVMRARGEPGEDEIEEAVLPALRLRRNLMYTEYKAADLYQEWRTGRLALVRLLSSMPTDRWVAVQEFLKAVHAINPDLLHTQSSPTVWWLESQKARRQFGTTFDDWQQSYGAFVLAALQGPLAWLGLVSLGYDEDGTLRAFKLTETGAFVQGRRHAPPLHDPATGAEHYSRDGARCSFGDNLAVSLAPNLVPGALHDLLHSTGIIEKATPDQFVYRLTAQGVRQWIESHVAKEARQNLYAVDGLIDEIERMCDSERPTRVPASWRQKLGDWIAHYGQLHVYEGLAVIELADDYAIRELMASTSLRDHVLYQFSPRLIAIRPDSIDILVQEMEKRGYTPAVGRHSE
jgi:hypothetical protein